jgi:DNA-binding SARP family transcriptional activator
LLLKTFGGLAVDVDGAPGTGAAQQRKTLALLALLAVAGRRGLSRDKLSTYLWPESDTEHARNLLKQACYALRRDLHVPELFLGAVELRLNPEVIASDIGTLEEALECGDAARAVAVYTGPSSTGSISLEQLNSSGGWRRHGPLSRRARARGSCPSQHTPRQQATCTGP